MAEARIGDLDLRPRGRGARRRSASGYQRRDRRPPLHLGADGREPRVLAAPQARGGGPPGAGRAGPVDRPPTRHRHRPPARPGAVPRLPVALTTFVGRAEERASLADALRANRLVTALGPGGVGKTRLAAEVVAEGTDELPEQAWFVDLVPVTDPAMVFGAVAVALGVGERHGRRRAADAVLAWLAERDVVLVLDNCEHVLDGAADCIDAVLPAPARHRVLATSRTRLLLPYETVFEVPGLSVDGRRRATRSRSSSSGRPRPARPIDDADRAPGRRDLPPARRHGAGHRARRRPGPVARARRARGRARRAAAPARRRPAGRRPPPLAAGDARLELRAPPRRRPACCSARSRCSPPRSPRTAATEVVDHRVARRRIAVRGGLGRLVDHSLLARPRSPGGTRYRALETVRQYGDDELRTTGELDATRRRHVAWCSATARGAPARRGRRRLARRLRRVVDDLRAARPLGRREAGTAPGRRAPASSCALADLLFQRGGRPRPSSATGAASGSPPTRPRRSTRCASPPARRPPPRRQRVPRALPPRRPTGARDRRPGRRGARPRGGGGDDAAAAPGIMQRAPGRGAAAALIAEARALAEGDPLVDAAVAVAEAFGVDRERHRKRSELAEHAVDLGERSGDPLARERGARPAQRACTSRTATSPARWPTSAAASTSPSRCPIDARTGFEISDGCNMASEVVPARRRHRARPRTTPDRSPALPFHREEGHLATARRLKVDAMAGRFDDVLELADRFRTGWLDAGRPVASNLAHGPGGGGDGPRHPRRRRGQGGVAGDHRRDRVRRIPDLSRGSSGWPPVFDAIVLLHHGDAGAALERLAVPPDRDAHLVQRHVAALVRARCGSRPPSLPARATPPTGSRRPGRSADGNPSRWR